MAHSSISYKDKLVFFREPAWELAMFALCKVFLKHYPKFRRLLEMTEDWIGELETYPPGLRNIELDRWLCSNSRISIFLGMVTVARSNQTDPKMIHHIENFCGIVVMKQIDPLRKD